MTFARAAGGGTLLIAVATVTWLTMFTPLAGIAIVALFLFSLWAWRHPVAAASSLAFLTAAFPKAGVRLGDFPLPVFLFGLVAAVLIIAIKSKRTTHAPITALLVGGYLTAVTARSLAYLDEGPSEVFAFVAWAGLPVLMLALTSTLNDVDPRFIRAFQWGFLVSVAYAGLQFAGGLEATAVPGLTQAFGDDITEKHNVIFVDGGENFSKIPSTYHNGNIYGLAAAFFLAYSLTRILNQSHQKLDISVALGALLAIGLSGSRTAIVAAALPVFILLLRRGSLRWRIGVIVLAAAAATAVIALEPDLARRYTVDAVLASGGSGRARIWEEQLSLMSATEVIFGVDSRAVIPDGWVGFIMQLGIAGSALLILAVAGLLKRRPEWRVAVLVLLIGAVIDSSYLTFPTWFIPAAMIAGSLKQSSTRGMQLGSSNSSLILPRLPQAATARTPDSRIRPAGSSTPRR